MSRASAPSVSWRGSMTALPTPFVGGAIDFPALLRLVELQIAGGSDGVVIGGTTGEAASLSADERETLFVWAVGAARGRVRVIAGVGSSDTRVACRLARAAQTAGVDGLIASTPAYNRPTQAGLARHFAAIAEVGAPLILYNVPARTSVDLLPATVAEIADAHPNVVAIKEASGSLDRVRELVALDRLAVLCGEDAQIADCMHTGAAGAISVLANLVPERVAKLIRALGPRAPFAGEAEQAPALVESLAPLVAALFVETNPAPLKAALEMMGLARADLRLPLVPVSDASRERVRRALVATGLVAA